MSRCGCSGLGAFQQVPYRAPLGARDIPYRAMGAVEPVEEEQIQEEGIFDYNWMPDSMPQGVTSGSHLVPYVDPGVPENGGTNVGEIDVYGIFATGRRPVAQTYDPMKPRLITGQPLAGWRR